jgi:hypothetical protein
LISARHRRRIHRQHCWEATPRDGGS